MHTKKYWYGLPFILLLVLAGCVHRMATKDDPPREETTTQKPPIEKSNKKIINGWEITQNPHPKVLEMHKGYDSYHDQFIFYFDTLSGVMDKNEVIEIAKKLLNCPPEDDFIYFGKDNSLNKKSVKNDKNSKVGRWYHKGLEVYGYRFNFKDVYKGKLANRLAIKYNKEFDANISGLISIDSAIQIVKANANSQFLSDRFCWDAPYNQKCSPKISLRIFPNIKMYAIKDYVLYYTICVDKNLLSDNCKIGIHVNPKTGETMSTPNTAGNANCSYCSDGSGGADISLMIDDDCSDSPDLQFSSFESNLTAVGSEANVIVPTPFDDCVIFPQVDKVEYSLNSTDDYFKYNVDYGTYTIGALTECMTRSNGTCESGGNPVISNFSNTSYDCPHASTWGAIHLLKEVQDYAETHFSTKDLYNNPSIPLSFLSDVPIIDLIYMGYNDNKAYMNTTSGAQPYIYIGTGDGTNIISNANIEVLAHEYTHHLLYNYGVKLGEFDTNESLALHEAVCDIYAHYFTRYIKNKSNDWLHSEEVATTSSYNLPRNLADPSMSKLAQAKVYNIAWDNMMVSGLPDGINSKDIRYYKAGVISYWFYLLSEGAEEPDNPDDPVEPINDITLSTQGLGIDKAEEILFNALALLKESIADTTNNFDGDVTFTEFRDVVLQATYSKYNRNNAYNICSNEFSQVYRAFQAVGLLSNQVPYNALNCNVISYDETFYGGCPEFNVTNQFRCDPVSDGQQFSLNFPASMSSPGSYYIQVFIDFDGDGNLKEEYSFVTAEGAIDTLETNDLSYFSVPTFTVPTDTTLVELTIYEVDNVNPENNSSADISLPFERYIFNCQSACSFVTDQGLYDIPINQGQISIPLNSSNFSTCADSEICIDYTATGPAQTFVSIDSDHFAHLITSITSTSQSGTFCWTPGESNTGTHNFQITATDGHPTQPITQIADVTVDVIDYSSDVWATASPVAYDSNESSAGANDGTVVMNLASNYTLVYDFNGPGGYNLVTQNNTAAGLADGAYTIDVYIYGTDCLYNTYTATVGTSSSGGSTCFFDPDLAILRAVPAIFNDQTIIEIELQEKPLQLNLAAFDLQGNPIQNLVNGQVLPVGTHQVPFDGSAEPNGLYIFNMLISVPQCRSGAPESMSIKGFKY